MKIFYEISIENLNRSEFTSWLLSEFPKSSFVLTDVISGNGLHAAIYQDNSSEPVTYEIFLDDLSRAAHFEDKWDWYILEKWYEYDLGFAWDYKPAERDWCMSCIKPADRKDKGNRIAFRHYSDFQRFEMVFGKESNANDTRHAQELLKELA